MSNELNVIIIGGAATYFLESKLPSIHELNVIMNNTKISINFHIYDINLTFALNIHNKLGALDNINILEDVKRMEIFPNIMFNDIPPQEINKNLKFSPWHTIYIVLYSKKPGQFINNCRSIYDIMSLINCYVMDNRKFFYFERETNIDWNQLINNSIQEQMVKIPNPFLGEIMQDKESLYFFLKSGSAIALNYLYSGFHQDRIEEYKTESWTLNIETPFIKGLIYTYGLYSNMPDIKNKEYLLLLSSANYRRKVFELVTKIVANLAINNNIIEPYNYNWQHPDVYIYIQQKIYEIKL